MAKPGKNDKLRVVYLGKTYEITGDQHDDLVNQVFKRLDGYIKSLISTNTQNQKTVQEYKASAEVRNGFFDAVTQAVIVKAGRVKYPNDALASASMKACVNLGRAQGSKDLALLKVALPQAEKAVNAFSADVMRFLNEFIGSAGTTATVLTVTSATCFAVVGALAAPVLVTAGMSAGGAAVASGAGVSVLSSAANELGAAASGQKMNLWESVKNVAVDGTIGAATAGIANKIPLGFVEKIAKNLAPRLASKVPGITAAQLAPFITKFLQGSGEETIKSAVGEAINIVGKIAKTGKAPTEKDFEEAVMKIVATALTAGLLKNLGGFTKSWAMKSRSTLEGKIFPDVLKDVMKGNNTLAPVMKAKVWADVINKVEEQVMQAGTAQVLDAAKGAFDEAKMTADAEKALLKDAKIRKLVEEEMKKSLKKNKIEVK
jgi:hypothetical protein